MHFPSPVLALFAAAIALPTALAQSASCDGAYAQASDLAFCANELTQRGNDACSVVGGFTTVFCEKGDAQIVGVGVETPSGRETSSPCVDIAIAVGHILDQCTSNIVPYGTVTAGQAYANNNQKIRVHAVHKQ